MTRVPLLALLALLGSLAGCAAAVGGGPALVMPMTADGWRPAPFTAWAHNEGSAPIRWARTEGMPDGTMTIADEAIAVSNGATFSQGTIEFDIKPLGYSDAGIIFHRRGVRDADFFYLRGNPDCPAADDCFQYAPITSGQLQWDIYPDRQGPAQIQPAGWNHVRLVVVGRMMAVYLDRDAEPSLVTRLQGVTEGGGIALKGPAVYANLVVRPGQPRVFPDNRPAAVAAGAVTAWTVAPPVVIAVDRAAPASAIPGRGAWRPIAAEPSGLVNLSRVFDGPALGAPSVAWLKTAVQAPRAMRRTIRLGWARQVSVFLNGKPVFFGRNPYRPVERRLSPDGRLEPDNASVPLDLQAGQNEIVLAVGNGWITQDGGIEASPYGWAAEAHLDDAR